MVIDPWGHIVAQCSDKVTSTSSRLDLDYISHVRRDVPVAQHHVLA
jgi:nitrilase